MVLHNPARMYSAEVLSQLRSLNHLSWERRRVPAGSAEAILLQEQIGALRARLPGAILDYHDHWEVQSQSSTAGVVGDGCGACHRSLPRELLEELAVPGHFGVCPHCGVFVWRDTDPQPGESASPIAPAIAKEDADRGRA